MIRDASIQDIPAILPMVQEFSKEIGNQFLIDNYSHKPTAALLASLVQSGILIVSEDADGELNGVVGGIVSGNIWNPSVKQVDEIIYYVKPEVRGSSLGWKLIKRYDDATKDYPLATLKLMHNSPDLTKHYNRLGYEALERTFMRGG